ncbi:hypothetical protein FBF32_03470 [Candidatus Saccharibacteria bacterium oral taxon 488]|nr:hypothetical protein FBF32_03470 [Candidatus Saccharibacteria bacterium oral taxon 488]QJU10366.1 hypothetical protein FBF26_03820 [Candidatus Saccharibacteria bacterium oral taxon 488]
MDEILAKIDTLTEQMNKQFESVDKRFEAMDKRLNDLEKGQASVSEDIKAIREDIKNSDDIFQLFELKTDHNFKKVMATQSDLKAELASLRTRLFLEEGSREHADTVGWDTQDKKWRALDKRLHAVEAHLGLG